MELLFTHFGQFNGLSGLLKASKAWRTALLPVRKAGDNPKHGRDDGFRFQFTRAQLCRVLHGMVQNFAALAAPGQLSAAGQVHEIVHISIGAPAQEFQTILVAKWSSALLEAALPFVDETAS